MTNKTEVTIDVIIHATEDISKFYDSFEKNFDIKPESFTVQNLSGHFDNPITMLNAKFTKKDANQFIEKFIQNIHPEELNIIVDELDELVSSSGLHLRLDKQEFVKGKLLYCLHYFVGEKHSSYC